MGQQNSDEIPDNEGIETSRTVLTKACLFSDEIPDNEGIETNN